MLRSPAAAPNSATRPSQAFGRGSWLVLGLLALGVVAATVAIWFQWRQTRRCLDFYGPASARRITTAPDVELLVVRPGRGPRSLATVSRLDVSHAAGLVHLRRGLVEDANFTWPKPSSADGPRPDRDQRPVAAWDAALVFRDQKNAGRTELVIDLDAGGGAIAVVGQPGWIGLGRIGPGLETWIRGNLEPGGIDASRTGPRPPRR